MSTLARSLVTWAEFLRLPERPGGSQQYELHDGEVVTAPPARPLHIKLQKRIERLLETLAGDRGVVTIENAKAISAYESPRTTKLYDRTSDEITLDEVERIAV